MTDIQKPDMSKQWANSGNKTPPADSLINSGWNSGDIPTNTDFNYIDSRQDQGLAYILQKGIPEWDNATEYQANKSWVQVNKTIYLAIATSTNKNPATETAFWVPVNGKFLNILSFGPISTTSQAYSTITAAYNSAVTNTHNLFLPANTTLDIGAESFPWRQQVLGGSLLDCKNIIIAGEGWSSVFKTSSATGADVFQLNGVKNIHFRDLAITATLSSSSGSGSNGISVTGGFDNITGDNILIYNLPRVDKSTYVDGAKAVTFQSDAATLGVGYAKFTNIYAKGCAQGVGVEVGLNNFSDERHYIEVDVVAEDCYQAVSVSAPEATSALAENTRIPVKIKATAINCQQDVVARRMYGGDVDVSVVTTKTKTQRTLAPDSVAWITSDVAVNAASVLGAKNSRVRVRGNKGSCDTKLSIGGISSGSAGHAGDVRYCVVDVDVVGTATQDVNVVDFGGNTVKDTTVIFSPSTTSSIPTALLTVSNANCVYAGSRLNMVDTSMRGVVEFYQTAAGNVKTGEVVLNGAVTALKGTATSSANMPVAGLADSTGTPRIGCVNGTGLAIDTLGSSSVLGSYVGKHPVYRLSDGAFLGYFPLYN